MDFFFMQALYLIAITFAIPWEPLTKNRKVFLNTHYVLGPIPP